MRDDQDYEGATAKVALEKSLVFSIEMMGGKVPVATA